jgi:hypothetical protein
MVNRQTHPSHSGLHSTLSVGTLEGLPDGINISGIGRENGRIICGDPICHGMQRGRLDQAGKPSHPHRRISTVFQQLINVELARDFDQHGEGLFLERYLPTIHCIQSSTLRK